MFFLLITLEVGYRKQNFQTWRVHVFWLRFDLRQKYQQKKTSPNSISSPPENCLGANLALIFVNFYICFKLDLIIWFWIITLFIILYFLFGGVLRKIYLPKFLIFEIHNGGYLAKKSKKRPNNTNFSVHLTNSRCFTIPKICCSVEQVW